jgi:hypothetical protein
MTPKKFTTTAQVQKVITDQAIVPVEITVNDRAATREAIIRKVRSLGHEFFERSGWKAETPKKALEYDWDYTMIALHHAGRSYSCGSGIEQMLDTQELHQKQFDDISYHFGIDCTGTVYEGRDIRFKGSNVRLYNTGVIGVVLLNNLTTPEEGSDWITFTRKALKSVGVDTTNKIPAPQKEATLNLITALKSFFFIEYFGGHMEYPGQKGEGKICPGRIAMRFVNSVRSKTNLLKPPEL